MTSWLQTGVLLIIVVLVPGLAPLMALSSASSLAEGPLAIPATPTDVPTGGGGEEGRILPPTITLVRPPTDTPRLTETPAPTHTVRPRPDSVQTICIAQPGETLSHIAKQYGVSVDALMATNHIADPHLIKIGQELIIPGPASGTQ